MKWKAACIWETNLSLRHFNWKPLLSAKIAKIKKSLTHNIAFSSEKVVSPESGDKYTHIKHHSQVKTVLNKYVGGIWWRGQLGKYFFNGGSVIMNYGLDQKQQFEVKNGRIVSNKQKAFHVTIKMLTGLESCGLPVDYCDVLISCLNSHSDGTHSLQRIHWWASDVM